MRATNRIAMFTIALTMLGAVGCATVSDKTDGSNRSLMQRLPWVNDADEEEQPYPEPMKLAATWTPDTLIQTGRTPTRGFGGRIYFYDQKSRPVPVEGTLIVHGFDETPKDKKGGVKRFEFTPEQFTKHFSKGDLGASYSVWIPWDAVGGNRKRISLVASFNTTDGKTVQGLPAVVMLPGAEPVKKEQALMAKLSPQYQNYKDALASRTSKASGLTTTTIKRRQYSPTSEQPGISVPSLPIRGKSVEAPDTMLAQKSSTPSIEIAMNPRLQTPDIRPASAELPIEPNAAQTKADKKWPAKIHFPSLRK